MGSSAWLLAPREAKGQGQKRKASLVRRAEEQYLWPWPWWVDEGSHTLVPTLHALPVSQEMGSGPASHDWPSERALVSPLPQGLGQNSWRRRHAKGRTLGVLCCLKRPGETGPGEVPVQRRSSPSKPLAKAGLLRSAVRCHQQPQGVPSRGFCPAKPPLPKMQGHLLRTAHLRLQLSHLLQQKLRLLPLLLQQSVKIPAGTGKQILSESGHCPLGSV